MSKLKEKKEVKDLDIIDMIEEEESKSKGKESKKDDSKPKKKPESSKKKKKEEAPVSKPKKRELPPHVADRRIKVKSLFEERTVAISVKDIGGTSKSVYVNDIHAFNPEILETIYWLRLVDHPYVIVRVTKEEYEFALQNVGKRSDHITTVIDCATNPTLSYGWRTADLSGGMPTQEQIKKKDKEFEENPTAVHNRPVRVEIQELINDDSASEEELEWIDDDEEFEIDFTSE